MRTLTVLRKNSMAGTNKAVAVYIEDHDHPDTVLEENVPCRRLGRLQMGEQKCFSVGEEAAKVYVVDEDVEDGLNGDRTQLPAGEKDLYLSGRIRHRRGTPFYFDGPATGKSFHYKPLTSRRGLIVVIAITACLLAPMLLRLMPTPGSSLDTTLQETTALYAGKNFTISLPGNFEEIEMEGYHKVYTTMDAAVYVNEEPYEGAEDPDFSKLTVEEYAQKVAANNRIDPKEIKHEGKIPYYEVQSVGNNGEKFSHFVFCYKGTAGFYMVKFSILEEHLQTYEKPILTWAQSVKVA